VSVLHFVKASNWKFYLLVGLSYGIIRIIGGLYVYPDKPAEMIVNNLWLTPYVIVVNFVLFEFSLIFLSVSAKSVVIDHLFPEQIDHP
jgi:hypothetical protein